MKLSKSKLALAKVINENGGWDDDSAYAANDRSGIIFGFSSKPIRHNVASDCWAGRRRNTWIRGIKTPQWHQCVLSREEYYQAYPKADADGWIEWKGGECPVEKGLMVDIRVRDGREERNLAANTLTKGRIPDASCAFWKNDGMAGDIIAYRLHNPDAKPEFCESVMRSIPEPKPFKCAYDPRLISLANVRIVDESIDDLCAKVTEENKHQHVDAKPTIEQLAQDYRNAKGHADRLQKEADDAKVAADVKFDEIEKLMESLGFSVIDVGFQSKSELLVNDWRDLKIGDYIRCIGDWQDEETHGLIFKVDDVECKEYEGELAIRVAIDDGDCAWGKDFEFISRP